MQPSEHLNFKVATEPWEFEQIHGLNYRTFVEEIPQHDANEEKSLIDKFHRENTYIICIGDHKLYGMVAVRAKRPFSLDAKLEDLDSYLPPAKSICELRLLAIERDRRHGRILQGLTVGLARYCEEQEYDLALISGTVKQAKLYRHLGFESFGPLVGTVEATYQPMYMTLAEFRALKKRTRALVGVTTKTPVTGEGVNLLPGPVGILDKVQRVFGATPVSHRSDHFMDDFTHTKQALCDLVRSREAAILMGSGTLANDVIAAKLSLLEGKGLILVNGEFGNRLVTHARAAALTFQTVPIAEGMRFEQKMLERAIDRYGPIDWLWAVHCETSTGVLNDLAMLKAVCRGRDILLCMDCISAIGTVPVDLHGVYLTSGVSGKGLGALAGLAMVFYDHEILPEPEKLPCYLDLGLYAQADGVPFTLSSNLLYALQTALDSYDWTEHFEEIWQCARALRKELAQMGFEIVAPLADASPAVITISLPATISSEYIGRQLEEREYLLSYKSHYLLQRNWIQICLMGQWPRTRIATLLETLQELVPVPDNSAATVQIGKKVTEVAE